MTGFLLLAGACEAEYAGSFVFCVASYCSMLWLFKLDGNTEKSSADQFALGRGDLGFTFDQTREAKECSRVDRITEEHLKEIQHKVAEQRRLGAQLRRIKKCCPGKGIIADC